MMGDIFNTIVGALQNQFLSGGLVLMLTASLLALCRRVPYQLWLFLLRRFTIVVDVSNDDPLFGWVALWLGDHPYSSKARSLTATSEKDEYGRAIGSRESSSEMPHVLFAPAPGNHLLVFKRRLVWLSRERKDAAPSSESAVSLWKREVFKIRVIGRTQDVARELLEAARSLAFERRHQRIEVFSPHYESWFRIDERDPRPLSSVFLPRGVAEGLVEDLSKFITAESWYTEMGIPWQRRYLFHGVPGSGKSSVICALAGHFRMNIYILNLGSTYLTDDVLLSLMGRVPSRSIVALEDIDAAFNQRTKSEDAKNKLTFSGLLNALDGLGAKDGSIVFMTTNHVELLDTALTRAGRADVKREFGPATAEQANRMFCAFFPEADGADGFGDKVEALGWSMADVQNHLIEHRDSAIRSLNSLTGKAKAA